MVIYVRHVFNRHVARTRSRYPGHRSGEYSIDREALPDRIVFAKLPRSGRQNKVDKNALRQLQKK
jgi:hypothetical protein